MAYDPQNPEHPYHRIQVFDTTGKFLRKWGMAGPEDGSFLNPVDLACLGAYVYVLDWSDTTGLKFRIQKFALDGTWIASSSPLVTNCTPKGMTAGRECGHLYVTALSQDKTYSYVHTFDSSTLERLGTYSSYASDVITNRQQLISRTVEGIAVCGPQTGRTMVITSGIQTRRVEKYKLSTGYTTSNYGITYGGMTSKSGLGCCFSPDTKILWVTDPTGNQILGLNPWVSGNPELYTTIGSYGVDATGLWYPHRVVCDSAGNLYIAELKNRRIHKMNPQGGSLLAFGKSGNGDGEFGLPMGVGVGSDGNIYTVDINDGAAGGGSTSGAVLSVFTDQFGRTHVLTAISGQIIYQWSPIGVDQWSTPVTVTLGANENAPTIYREGKGPLLIFCYDTSVAKVHVYQAQNAEGTAWQRRDQ
jgi:hypothetical protein